MKTIFTNLIPQDETGHVLDMVSAQNWLYLVQYVNQREICSSKLCFCPPDIALVQTTFLQWKDEISK